MQRGAIIKALISGILAILPLLTIHGEKRLIDNLPATSRCIENFSNADLTQQLSEEALHHIEGIWQFPATGVKIAILRENIVEGRKTPASESEIYEMIVVWSPNRATRPGTVMGYISPSAKRGEYDAKIYTGQLGTMLNMPKRFKLRLDSDDSSLTFRQHRSKFNINLWRLLPYLCRHVITRSHGELESDGCFRIFPAPTLPREPIYL